MTTHRAAGAIALLLAAAGAASAQSTVLVNFDFYPGPDGVLGTGDDVPIEAPASFAGQTLQLTNEFASVGLRFSTPVQNDRNEILISTSFTTPPTHTRPNLLASSGTLAIEAEFDVTVTRVEALIGISGGADTLQAFDSGGALLGSVVGDDTVVFIASARPIARIRIFPSTNTTPAIDNLRFDVRAVCYADCDTSTGLGVLDIFDFLCFQNRFAASAPYACDCDTSTGTGVCDIFDFLCFQNAFAAGCP